MTQPTTKVVGRSVAALVAAGMAAAWASDESLPAVQHPPENLPSPEKQVLGKILFFEEQLSSDDSVACATCHVMSTGGTDPRRGRSPGQDGQFAKEGDVFGSPGVISMDAASAYDPSGLFGMRAQVTPRTAPSMLGAMYSGTLLWDGRAADQFKDPVTGAIVVPKGGALESQALLPLTNPVEMGHKDRDWPEILAKLARVEPLALADRIPPDMAGALADAPDYAELFRRAFGDGEISPARIALAIADYERTLVPDHTDYDRFVAGDGTALSDQEKRGLLSLQESGCTACHSGPNFTDGTFRATGVRPHPEDKARALVTKDKADDGRWKVPSLRNVALKRSFFHDGERSTLLNAVRFYDRLGQKPKLVPVATGEPEIVQHYGVSPIEVQFLDNQDPAMDDIHLTSTKVNDIVAFLSGGLVDPRVQNETYPFDRPRLASERDDLEPRLTGAGRPGQLGVPEIVIATPAVAGNDEFRVAVSGGVTGQPARLVSWTDGPGGAAVDVTMSEPVVMEGSIDGGCATVSHSLAGVEPGTTLHFMWQCDDPVAGAAKSRTADVTVVPKRSAAGTVATQRPQVVGDAAAYVESASFRVDWAARARGESGDRFAITARINPRGVGPDLTAGRLTISVGGGAIVVDAPLDAAGAVSTSDVQASFDPETGRVVANVGSLRLGSAFDGTGAGGRGTIDVPVSVQVRGLAILEPVASTTISFGWKGRAGTAATGRFSFAKTGTGAGVFHVNELTVNRQPDGRFRVIAKAVLDPAGASAFQAPAGLTVTVGDGVPMPLGPSVLVASRGGATIRARNAGGVRVLAFDLRRRTVLLDTLVEAMALPTLASAPPGTSVPVRLRIDVKSGPGFIGQTFDTQAPVESK